jgi:hypothetical protein
MQHLEVSGVVRYIYIYIYMTLGGKGSGERCPTNAQGRCKQFLLCSVNYPDMFRLPNAIFRGLHYPGTHSTADGHTEWTIAHTHLKRRLKNWSSLRKDSATPWRWHLEAETCRGNVLSTIKKTALEHLLDIFHMIIYLF